MKSQIFYLLWVAEHDDGTFEARINLGGGRAERKGPDFESAVIGAFQEAVTLRSLPDSTQGPESA